MHDVMFHVICPSCLYRSSDRVQEKKNWAGSWGQVVQKNNDCAGNCVGLCNLVTNQIFNYFFTEKWTLTNNYLFYLSTIALFRFTCIYFFDLKNEHLQNFTHNSFKYLW